MDSTIFVNGFLFSLLIVLWAIRVKIDRHTKICVSLKCNKAVEMADNNCHRRRTTLTKKYSLTLV